MVGKQDAIGEGVHPFRESGTSIHRRGPACENCSMSNTQSPRPSEATGGAFFLQAKKESYSRAPDSGASRLEAIAIGLEAFLEAGQSTGRLEPCLKRSRKHYVFHSLRSQFSAA